jgi:hypothetical protein
MGEAVVEIDDLLVHGCSSLFPRMDHSTAADRLRADGAKAWRHGRSGHVMGHMLAGGVLSLFLIKM